MCMMRLRMAALLRGAGLVDGQRLGAVNLAHGQCQPELLGKVDDINGTVRRHGLSGLVVTDISLGATNTLGELRLRQAEKFADGFDFIHALILAALMHYVNSGADSFFHQRR